MTGVAELYQLIRRPHSKNAWAHFTSRWKIKDHEQTRFVVLSWKRTGSNLLCGIFYHHPGIAMHNELFNTIDIFTYYPNALYLENNSRWTVLGRDMKPEAFLDHIWSGRYENGAKIRPQSKAVGFKSFPEHWRDSDNEHIFKSSIMNDPNIKKIILQREDELAVFVSMLRAEVSGAYMTHAYPANLCVFVDPAKFQAFVNNYRSTFQRLYVSPYANRDTFRITYEQLTNEKWFAHEIAPMLWRFLGVDPSIPAKRLEETVKQSTDNENLAGVISNFESLEFCFRHTDVKLPSTFASHKTFHSGTAKSGMLYQESELCLDEDNHETWSVLLPICSRKVHDSQGTRQMDEQKENINRFAELERTSTYSASNCEEPRDAWRRLRLFVEHFVRTTTKESRAQTEFIVGVDVDDPVFSSQSAKERIKELLPADVMFVTVKPVMYGKICRIWNILGARARNDFIILLGDDVEMVNKGWQRKVEERFQAISSESGLPYGAACVALNDLSFPGFPTFPVIHRWHVRNFGRILPRQFVNQGGDPYLFELYSRWNASDFVMSAQLKNTLGGDSNARYKKHAVNWRGVVLRTGIEKLKGFLAKSPLGICIDVVVPSYRLQNLNILNRILSLRGSIRLYVRFWLIVDNPDFENLRSVRALAERMNNKQNGNYFVFFISYGANRGASYARTVGFNYSTADWVLFLDDDVVPDENILDAYAGALLRYPAAKVFIGLTEMPEPCNLWTEMLKGSNVMFFFGIAKHRTHPPWGVTANVMVRGSRHNHTVQFRDIYPKTGGGEDVDFIFQLKQRYGDKCTAAVPGAKVRHPWWKDGKICYHQICGWAWGDSLCVTEWPNKTFQCMPNWIEFLFLLLLWALFMGYERVSFPSVLCIVVFDHLMKVISLFSMDERGWFGSVIVAIGASTIISAQECTRLIALLRRRSYLSMGRRMDWFDGQANMQVQDIQIRSVMSFILYVAVCFFV